MTVAELIESLQELVEQSPELAGETVFTSYNYGDRNNTEAISAVHCAVHAYVAKTAYSSSGLRVMCADEVGELEEGDPIPERRVVLGQEHEYHYQ